MTAGVRVGVIGRGFGARFVAPAFEATEGCEVVDVVSPRDAGAVAALCARADVDLVSVHSPPFLHLDNVRTAIEAGHAVVCDKPFGRNAGEAEQMHDLARDAGVVNLLNFENRYDPARERLRRLVQEGAIGQPDHFRDSTVLATTRVPLRPYGWLFDDDLGGGWLRSLGSHEIDFVRWCFGEVVDAVGELRTTITERPDVDGQMHECTADDGFTAALRLANGVTAIIDSTSASPLNLPPEMMVIGTDGVLHAQLDRITLARPEQEVEHIEVESGPPLLFAQQRYAALVRDAVQRGAAEPGTPTFADGLACVQVMDQLRRRPVPAS